MNTKIHPVILAGGSGTRLWPLSRAKYPKQFIPFINQRSLFQEACLRFKDEDMFTTPLIVTHEEYRFLVLEQLQQIGLGNAEIIIEPVAKNTAASFLTAALYLQKKEGDVPLLISPSDHLTDNDEDFIESIKAALPFVISGKISVFGITPTYPHPGYGYIIRGEKLSDKVYVSSTFIEKPSTEKAQEMIEKDKALWNSGVYCVTTQTLIQEMQLHAKNLSEQVLNAFLKIEKVYDYLALPKNLYEKVESMPSDKAISEKSKNMIITQTSVTWTDLGSWSAVYQQLSKDENGNVVRGDVVTLNTKNSYIESTNRLVTTYGLKDIGIIETKDAVAVFPLHESDNVKLLVQELEKKSREEILTHTVVKRPWGEYEILDVKENYQLKRLTVYPGGSSSLQRHSKRSEHWLIIEGTATVTKNTEIVELKPDDTIYIPVGSLHKIENKTDKLVTLIETQTGTYFGEDDIERLDDKYGRL
jgi:mannose-1-phosphate guanylyltransferase/mannose-6-phosphate isomerase